MQPPLGIKQIGQPKQIPLIGPAAVVENEQTLSPTGSRALEEDE
jgi:hypothetical protein